MNLLLLPNFDTPHQTFPFADISTSDIAEAISEGMRLENEEITRIIENPQPPTFENTIIALNESGKVLERATTLMYNQLSANTNDELEQLAEEMSPVLSAHSSAIMLNAALFERVRAVSEHRQPEDAEDRTLLEKTMRGFVRSGAALDSEKKEQLKAIRAEMAQLTLQFDQNRIKETNAYELYVEDPAQLDGLPETQLEAAAAAAREHGKEGGWLFTLHAPSYQPFMQYAKNEELRRQMYMAANTRCTHDNGQNNYEICRKLINLRLELAQLMGYPHFAAYVLENRMAESTERVNAFIDDLCKHYKEAALKDMESVEQMKRETMGAGCGQDAATLNPWDYGHYSHLLKLRDYHIDAEKLRPYFPLERVITGVFGLATRLYGISFKEAPGIPVYHPDVKAYEVMDCDGKFLAVLYADFFPRKNKQSGAWMTSYREEGKHRMPDGTWGEERPHVSVTMNFSKPTDSKPALLRLGEVCTFLHEFGHALHGIFANTRYQALSGTNVLWDFVELPSQFMENFALEPEFLRTFAKHYVTGEPIPDELIAAIRRARNFNAAYSCIRQVSFGMLDMAFYTRTTPIPAPTAGDAMHPVAKIEHEVWEHTGMMLPPRETSMAAQFGHIISGGYAAGYYSYKWAEVLDADAYECFKEHGIFDRTTAERFRETILSRGGTRHPMELYRDFRGHDATIDALLRRDGISTANSTH